MKRRKPHFCAGCGLGSIRGCAQFARHMRRYERLDAEERAAYRARSLRPLFTGRVEVFPLEVLR